MLRAISNYIFMFYMVTHFNILVIRKCEEKHFLVIIKYLHHFARNLYCVLILYSMYGSPQFMFSNRSCCVDIEQAGSGSQ